MVDRGQGTVEVKQKKTNKQADKKDTNQSHIINECYLVLLEKVSKW